MNLPVLLLVPVAVVLIALPALLLVLLLRGRASARRSSAALQDGEARLALALWANGARDWDYDVRTGVVRGLHPDAAAPFDRAVDGAPVAATSWLHPDDRTPACDALARYLAGESEQLEFDARVTGAGVWAWRRFRGRVLARDARGRIARIGGTASDLEASRDDVREQRIGAEVMRSMHGAVAVLDDRFDVVSVNPAFSRISGYSDAEILGRNARLLDSDQHDAAFHEAIRDQIRRNGHWTGELWQRRKDGEEFLAAIEVRSVQDGDRDALLHVCVLHDITRQKRAEQELRYLANFDTLTSLPNRALLSERLARAILRAHREDARLAVLLLDLDQFKHINDSLGHATGDRILRAAATRLQQAVGMHHTVARLGGDEFAVVVEDLASPAAADHLAREVITAFEAPLLLDDRREIAISPSIGISLYPEHARVPTELLKQADTAMYQAKAAGRRTFMRYDDGMDHAIRQRATVAGALRRALDRGELRLVFQPRMSLHPQRITGVEALLRWSSPEHGEIMPSVFIPIAEESGLILEIGEWVLREACLVLHRWRQHGLDDLTVSVNVSVLQLLRGDFPDVVARVLQDVGIPPGLLELELTESVLMANAAQASEKLQAFRALGVSLAIDDFGTGYSSLAYLKRLPFTTIKVDKAFIDGLPEDPEDAAIAGAVIAMAHSLGLAVVAEGVETEAQMRFLAGRGCDEIQGFWVSTPLDALQCLAFIRNWRPSGATPGARPVAAP
ncbi:MULTISPECIES: putative bifunctional diguanylate cyclase/phosphodiesterase [Luteimonas]|uniref:putative bifunctional diguanylate cyclase/phosphodiesterase n=1 Tax=Luteimonas TaxID=83614 RepID=UPI000C7A239A|nr:MULTISPECIES: EAL domain-containing protein [Luteimonas]